MNPTLLEELLNEEESATLDLKGSQYPFQAASDHQKSELLKDILAFANAWRRTDAYILIGVEEVKGGRSRVVGVTTHFDDASIQQFVNAKTNRPVSFFYEVIPFEGVQVDVIQIPIQDRPIYLNKDYGNLKQHGVYIRRGSSTAVAAPDEVAKMGGFSLSESLGGTPTLSQSEKIIKALRQEMEEKNVVIVERELAYGRSPREQYRVSEVNDLYAVFSELRNPEKKVPGPIDKITISYVPKMGMKLITISR